MCIVRLDIRLIRQTADKGQSYRVVLESPGGEPAEDDFGLDPRDSTLAETRLKIETGDCEYDDLRELGTRLWEALLAGKVRDRFDAIWQAEGQGDRRLHIRLSLPVELEPWPWEILHDLRHKLGFLAAREQFSIIRDAPGLVTPRAPAVDRKRPLGMLLVMPGGSGLNLTRERQMIERRTGELGAAVRLEVLDGQVTADLLRETIRRASWDILHFAGHARAAEEGEVEIRLNKDDAFGSKEHWMPAEAFSTLFNSRTVRLAFMNCCQSAVAAVQPSRALSGLGPLLLGKGVPAVIAMRYEILDVVSLRFADEVYRELFRGSQPGRVDLAVESGRTRVYQNQEESTIRGFITPALYLVAGQERLFDLDPPQSDHRAEAPPPPSSRPWAPRPDGDGIPSGLLNSLRDGKCIPVIGPGLLSVGAVRSEPVPPGPRQLARRLADESGYPSLSDFDVYSRADDWIDSTLLQWVCDYFQTQEQIEHRLYALIEEEYGRCQPSAAFRGIASWKVPGIICTHFDGLMEQALKDRKEFQIINLLHQGPSLEPAAPLLVHLRGTWTDPASLVLTEEDHEQLWDRLANLPPRVTDLVHGTTGRSLLLLGMHPRDPLARRLCARLLRRETSRTVGPLYFVHPDQNPIAEGFWKNYKSVWVAAGPEAVLRALDGGAAS